MRCVNGQGEYEDHEAEGWIVSPEGWEISPSCERQARATINEYREKLGERWSFAPFALRLRYRRHELPLPRLAYRRPPEPARDSE